jgi:hypothetical protein
MQLTILGPNLPGSMQRVANIHVHAAGCADLKRGGCREAIAMGEACTEEHASMQTVVESFYGPSAGGFYGESGIPEADWPTAWKDPAQGYLADFHFAPCTAGLAFDEPTE